MAKLRSPKWQRSGTWKLQPWSLRVKKKPKLFLLPSKTGLIIKLTEADQQKKIRF